MNFLITGAWNCTNSQLDEIKNEGHNIFFMQDEKGCVPCDYNIIEAVICNGLFLYHAIEKFTSLRYIQLTSAGVERAPLDYIKLHNIELHNARGVYSIPMAEFAISGVLQLYKQSRFFYENQQRCVWRKNRGLMELFGKTVCVVGCGSVGTECAKRFQAFGCSVIGLDLYPREDCYYEKIYPLSKIDDCLSISNIVILTLPLTKDTKNLINSERFDTMKKGSVLVNIARGAIVEEKALLRALDEKLLGAVLDVFEEEPLVGSSPLWEKKNVILTPHSSFVGDGNGERLFQLIKSNMRI